MAMKLSELVLAVNDLIRDGRYSWWTDPLPPHIPPGGLWLRATAQDATDVIHHLPPYPVHPLEALASKECYGEVCEYPTWEQADKVQATRASFARAVNVWGKPLGYDARLTSLVFCLFTPIGLPAGTLRFVRDALEILTRDVWTLLDKGDPKYALEVAGEWGGPGFYRPNFWSDTDVADPDGVGGGDGGVSGGDPQPAAHDS